MPLSKFRTDLITSTDVESTSRTRRAFPPIAAVLPDDALVRVRQIIGDAKSDPPLPAFLPVSRSKFYAMVRGGHLPPPVRLPGSSSSLWRLGEIRAAVAKLTGSER